MTGFDLAAEAVCNPGALDLASEQELERDVRMIRDVLEYEMLYAGEIPTEAWRKLEAYKADYLSKYNDAFFTVRFPTTPSEAMNVARFRRRHYN